MFFGKVRVEINPKGKFRARKLNYVQPAQINQIPYPLKLKALTRFQYFQTREQWRVNIENIQTKYEMILICNFSCLQVTDFLFSPMILMMVLPLILLFILPRMMNDPETKKEMESMNLNKISSEMPEISEMITSFFTGAKPSKRDEKNKPSTTKQLKKRN